MTYLADLEVTNAFTNQLTTYRTDFVSHLSYE